MPEKSEQHHDLRDALGSFPTGVCVVTTADAAGTRVGLTVNSYTSVSLDPPLVLWCLAKSSKAMPFFKESEHFAVNILSKDQLDISNRFAGSDADKFKGLACEPGEGGAPLLEGCAARFQCKKWSQHDGGDHVIFIGEVVGFDQSDRPSLAFYRGGYATTSPMS